MRSGELEELRARAEALEQMLEIYERTVAEQAEKLEEKMKRPLEAPQATP